MNRLLALAHQSKERLAMPIAVFPGARLTGANVRHLVTSPQAQFEAQAALHNRFRHRFLLSAMDLSAEAEAFGAEVHLADDEVPTVLGRLAVTPGEIERLSVPEPGRKRTRVYLETVALLRKHFPAAWILGGCIGPFSLAARLHGVSEIMTLTVTDPDLTRELIKKTARFLVDYLKAFKQVGASGAILAEPTAGLLSPRSLAEFSSTYVRDLVAEVADEDFALVLHNCAAKAIHLSAVVDAGAPLLHFGAPMDMNAALEQAPADRALCGNLDPTAVFARGTPDEVQARTRRLLEATAGSQRFVISTGCDLPAAVPLENLDAFYETVKRFNAGG